MIPHKAPFIIILLLLCINCLTGQVKRDFNNVITRDSYEILSKELKKETGNQQKINDSSKPNFFTLIPERLPGWVNNMPVTPGNKLYLLGISDPGMDKETGLLIAKLRMIMVYSLVTETIVSNMRNFYTREEQHSYANAFMDYTQFTNQVKANLNDIHIINSHTTKYNETILLGEFELPVTQDKDKLASLMQTSAGIMSNARRVGTRTEIISKTSLNSNYTCELHDENFELSYETNAINKRINSETILDGKTISSLPALNLRYTVEGLDNTDSLLTSNMEYSLSNGIWHAYMTAIFFELADLAHGNAINISTLNEIFNNSAQNLTREIVTSPVNCTQLKMIIDSNNLYLKCTD